MDARKILVIDDSSINRTVLKGILKNEYEIIEAKNGKEALEIIQEHNGDFSLILLDLMMPIMNGYEFLENLQKDSEFSSIPVIVETSNTSSEDEIKSLYSGASDFIVKPYEPEIIKNRVNSIIRLRESSSIINHLKFDKLTNLMTAHFFYMEVEKVLKENPGKEYDLLCSNVVNFKLINDQYGRNKGDFILKYISEEFKKHAGVGAVVGTLGADRFAVLIEHWDKFTENKFNKDILKTYGAGPLMNIDIKFGIYQNVDKSLTAPQICDRAAVAMERNKKRYANFISQYDESLIENLRREQQIVDGLMDGIKNREFQVYYQPKHNMVTGELIGAEALIRWEHPELGFLPPIEFISIFEKTGLITKLDFYVLEEVCGFMKQRRDNGLDLTPVSINISRVDFYDASLADNIIDVVRKYGINPKLIHIEITESAYMDKKEQIIFASTKLKNEGFKIEIDDFGTGYSSLNTLCDIPFDIIKLDMRFIQEESLSKKSLLPFVARLAAWLEVDVIAEGVETKEQIENLVGMNIDLAQGYYYSKPMPQDDWSEYLKNSENLT